MSAAYLYDVPGLMKRERLEELLEVQRAIPADRVARFVGREVEFLVDRVADPVEEGGGATHVGRVRWQADDVDGVTYVERGGWAAPSGFLRARVAASADYELEALALTCAGGMTCSSGRGPCSPEGATCRDRRSEHW